MKASCLFLIFSFFICNTILAQPDNNSTDTKWLSFTDTAFHYSFQYPSDWEFKPKLDVNTRFFVTSYKESESDKFRENLNCIARDLGVDLAIRSAESEIMKSLTERLKNFNLISSDYSTWNKSETLQLEYSCTQEVNGTDTDIHMLQKMTIIKGVLYTLTFTAQSSGYDKFIGPVKRMISSFIIK